MDQITATFYRSFIRLKILINNESLKLNKIIEENKFTINELEQFKINREVQYSIFQKKLTTKYKSLNATEIRFCCYLWFNLPKNIIKQRFQLKKSEIKKITTEIKGKLNICESIDLGNYLRKIEATE